MGAQSQGQYRNPILWGDYSDPDVIRVGKTYVLVASSFMYMPGIPVLTSTDLLHWKIAGHVFPRLTVSPQYDLIGGDRYGGGAWAPAIRFHAGRYYVYFPTPNEGIFFSTASRPEGPWTKPKVVMSGPGFEDPCPFWDSDGKAYLIHSKLGAGPLILHRLSRDGSHVLDRGTVLVDDPKELPTLEGPKLYKRDGYYYIFAPYGGVTTGSEVVLRSRTIWGPYEHRTVLQQGDTSVNGPHQGGYVQTPDGRGWFLHFHSAGAYGRIDYLEPVVWHAGWPLIGMPIPGTEAGEPVETWVDPIQTSTLSAVAVQSSDEFSSDILGPQWEWNHNPDDAMWSLSERKGFLRLHATLAPDLLRARNTLTQMGQDPSYTLTASLDVSGMADGQRSGLTMLCDKPGEIFVAQEGPKKALRAYLAGVTLYAGEVRGTTILLRVAVANSAAQYSWSTDGGATFHTLGGITPFFFSWWKAARPGLFSYTTKTGGAGNGFVDVDWVHYEGQR